MLSILFNKIKVVFSIAGLGHIFFNKKMYLRKNLFILLIRFAVKFNKSILIFQNNESITSEFNLSSETKQFIELLLNQIVSQNLDNVIQEIIGHKIERKNKVLDLSDVEVSTKIDTQ